MPELSSQDPDAAHAPPTAREDRPGADHAGPEPTSGEQHPLWRAPLLVGAGAAAASIAVLIADPRDTGVPICWSQGLLGIDCPLCGGLRAANTLLRGDIVAAADHNVLLAVAMPVVAVLWAVWLYRSIRGERFRLPSPPAWLIGVAVVLVVAFTVLRNLDGSGWIGWLGATA